MLPRGSIYCGCRGGGVGGVYLCARVCAYAWVLYVSLCLIFFLFLFFWFCVFLCLPSSSSLPSSSPPTPPPCQACPRCSHTQDPSARCKEPSSPRSAPHPHPQPAITQSIMHHTRQFFFLLLMHFHSLCFFAFHKMLLGIVASTLTSWQFKYPTINTVTRLRVEVNKQIHHMKLMKESILATSNLTYFTTQCYTLSKKWELLHAKHT